MKWSTIHDNDRSNLSRRYCVSMASHEERSRADSFGAVTFGQSFHLVDPEIAIPKLSALLVPGGVLGLAWNSIEAVGELGERLNAIHRQYPHPPDSTSATEPADDEDPTTVALREAGFDIEELTIHEDLAYSADDWVSMVFTYSWQLTMEPSLRARLRADLLETIGNDPVPAANDAVLIRAIRR